MHTVTKAVTLFCTPLAQIMQQKAFPLATAVKHNFGYIMKEAKK